MSIISDALRKAQRRGGKPEPDKKGIPPESMIKNGESKPKPKVKKFLPTFFVVVLILFIVYIGFNIMTGMGADFGIRGFITRYNIQGFIPGFGGTDVETTEIPEELPLAPGIIYNPRSFSLTGIVFGDTNPYVVINDKILEVGDYAGTAEIVKIEKDRVTLKSGETTIILTLK